MSNSKEEIFKKHVAANKSIYEQEGEPIAPAVFLAMDEYAQQVAIEFDQWKHKNKWVQYLGFDTPTFNQGGKPEAGKQFYFSSEELFNLLQLQNR